MFPPLNLTFDKHAWDIAMNDSCRYYHMQLMAPLTSSILTHLQVTTGTTLHVFGNNQPPKVDTLPVLLLSNNGFSWILDSFDHLLLIILLLIPNVVTLSRLLMGSTRIY